MADYTLNQVNDMYVDVLKEIGNIGAGNATTAMANMLNIRINMDVPRVELLTFQELGSAICPEDESIVVCIKRNRKYHCRFLSERAFCHDTAYYCTIGSLYCN